MFQESDKSMLDRLFGDRPDLIKYSPQWSKMVQSNQLGEFQQVLDMYNQLPEDLQNEKFILTLRLRAAQAVDKRDYLAALDLWRRLYPNDPSLDLLSVDAFLLHKDYVKALESVDRFAQAIGGDPYQDFIKAAISVKMQDDDQAVKYARQAFEAEPDLTKSGLLAIGILNKQQKFSDCVQVLEELHIMAGFPKSTLDRMLGASPKNNALLQSDAYQKWLGAARSSAGDVVTPPARGE
jgi:tetratricopeptide (TPR) repeat protein